MEKLVLTGTVCFCVGLTVGLILGAVVMALAVAAKKYKPSTIQSLINNIEEITTESVNAATESFKVAHRPINPITEGTNRGKNVYTRFKPYQKLATKTVIRDPKAHQRTPFDSTDIFF